MYCVVKSGFYVFNSTCVINSYYLLYIVLLHPMMMITLCCTATQRKTKEDFTIAQQVHVNRGISMSLSQTLCT